MSTKYIYEVDDQILEIHTHNAPYLTIIKKTTSCFGKDVRYSGKIRIAGGSHWYIADEEDLVKQTLEAIYTKKIQLCFDGDYVFLTLDVKVPWPEGRIIQYTEYYRKEDNTEVNH